MVETSKLIVTEPADQLRQRTGQTVSCIWSIAEMYEECEASCDVVVLFGDLSPSFPYLTQLIETLSFTEQALVCTVVEGNSG